jgi:TonB family protein
MALTATPPPSPAPCPYSIRFAAYQANGTTHDNAEYVAYLKGGDGKAFSASFALVGASGTQTVSVVAAAPDSAFLFITHRPDVTSIQLTGVSEAGGAAYSDCGAPFPIPQIDWTVTPTFDDTVSWIVQGAVTAFAISRPQPTAILQPEYPDELRKKELQGTCRVAVDIDATGAVADAELLASSGDPLLDAIAQKAAVGQRFVPARLPAGAGGGNTAAALDLTFAFSPGMVTVREQP